MVEIDPTQFRFGNYGADIPFDVFVDDITLLKWLNAQVIVGFSRTPQYRTIKGTVAVLFNIDSEEYWSHIPDRVFEAYQLQHINGG